MVVGAELKLLTDNSDTALIEITNQDSSKVPLKMVKVGGDWKISMNHGEKYTFNFCF